MDIVNCYADTLRAEAYAKLDLPGTYYLAYRDLAEIIFEHAEGRKALDFGCGAGRSTRFLREHGFETIGLDIAGDMIKKAREIDPQGDYRHMEDGDFSRLESGAYDLVTSVFTFDNIPTMEKKVSIFKGLKRLLKDGGVIINLVSSPEIYVNEWASFTTRAFPENRLARSGDKVKIVMTDVEDRRPVEDILWSDGAYRQVFDQAGLQAIRTYRPLGREEEPYPWISETKIAPWVIYVLKP